MFASSLTSSRCGSLQAKRWPECRNVLRSMLLSAVVAMSTSAGQTGVKAQVVNQPPPPPPTTGALFIGDVGDDSIKQVGFSPSGISTSVFVAPKSAGLNGPRGMIFVNNQLVVVNQNVSTGQNGEVLVFDDKGTFSGKLVASSDNNAPFAPRGIVRGATNHSFYVASLLGKPGKCADAGGINVYSDSGAFQHTLTANPQVFDDGVFHPRGVVFGPDGTLYVSAVGCLDPKDSPYDPVAGYILTFGPDVDVDGKLIFHKVLASHHTVSDLHRPEGLVIDSTGNLWVTSFRIDPAAPTDTDKLLKIDGQMGSLLDEIELDAKANKPHPNPPRAPAQAIILGPGGDLFVPISGTDSSTAGEVLQCDPTTHQCPVLIQPHSMGGGLRSPWYLVFKTSNPATLSYGQ
ncbi:hypothetical protein VSR34_22330 [Paraburkholderia sp. JHI2823]|uniref:hypothetical protein n=1 Tax=Paraburkholderia sp. JHI2823 TaxID=3112960 RepID=UPI0031727FD5